MHLKIKLKLKSDSSSNNFVQLESFSGTPDKGSNPIEDRVIYFFITGSGSYSIPCHGVNPQIAK